VAVLRQQPHDRAELRERSGFSARKLTQLLTLLEEVGAVVADSGGRLRSPDSAPLPVAAARLALAEVERHQTVQRTRVDMMRQFAESRTCRSQSLLTYFGDRIDGPCGHCDNCAATATTAAAPEPVRGKSRRSSVPRQSTRVRSNAPVLPARPDRSRATPPARAMTVPAQGGAGDRTGEPFPLHSTVRHRTWGTGTVLGYEADRMTVLFESVGYKTLSVGVVRKQDLLVSE
jgi:ATP-dependent DNA helicase RecQ